MKWFRNNQLRRFSDAEQRADHAGDGFAVGETVAYQYDALKRLTSAASTPNAGSTPTAWTETYGYDGFGNLTSKVLNGTTAAIGVTTVSTNGESGSQLELTRAVCTGRVDQTVHDAWRTVQRFLSELPRDKAKAMRLLGFAWRQGVQAHSIEQKISTLQLVTEYTDFGREGQCLSVDVVSNKGIVHIDADDGCYLRSDGDFTTMHFEVMGKSEGIEPFIVKIEFEPLPH